MEETNILVEFKEILKSKHSDIASVYHHLFSLLSDQELKDHLDVWKTIYIEDK